MLSRCPALLAATACLTLLTLAACQRSDPGGAAPGAGAPAASGVRAGGGSTQSVSVFAAQQRDMPVTVEASGTVVALDTVEVRPQLSGTIAEVLVRDGQFVQRGQPLFRLDVRAERANADRARAQLLRDQAALADLERQWKRTQELRAQNFIAQAAADTVLSNLESQRAAVSASQAALRATEVSVGFGTINAPLTGKAGAVAVHRGALVQPGGTALLGINQIDPIGVSFSVPEAQLGALLNAAGGPSVGDGAEVIVALPGTDRGRPAIPPASGASAAAATTAGGTLRGRVVFVDNAVDTTTGSIRVKAALANKAQALWPGQYVTVRMTTRTLKGVLVIPQAALVIRGSERSVYVVKADSTVEMRPVQTRMASGEFVVVDGLQPGERVVVDGKQNVRNGGTVRATPFQPAGAERRSGRAAAAASGASAPAGGRAASGPAGLAGGATAAS
jgi:RND family efflux transporter MFP subunit